MMVTIRTLATIGVLVSLGSEASIAMPPQDIPTEIKSCKAITDDQERLKCFDGLFGEIPKPQILRRERKRIGQSMKPNRLLMEVVRLSRRTS